MSKNWTLVSRHGHALLALSKNPDLTIDDLSRVLGVTSRSVVNVLNDLEAEGYLSKTREGRRNRYVINLDAKLRHQTSAGHTVRDLLAALGRIDGK
jgi:DNA-binding MarR family transcriptional regulator